MRPDGLVLPGNCTLTGCTGPYAGHTSSGRHPYSRIVQLRSLGVEVVYRAGDLDDVARWLAQGQPVIAFVQLRELPYWDGHWAQHALVIIGLDETTVQVLDPARDEQVIPIPRTDFTLAWDEMDNTCAVLTRRT